MPAVEPVTSACLPASPSSIAASRVLADVVDHLAVVGQGTRLGELDLAADLADRADRAFHRLPEVWGRLRRLDLQGHDIGLIHPVDDETQATEAGMLPGDLGNLLRIDEHAAHLGALVGTPHPALDPHVGAPARARPR